MKHVVFKSGEFPDLSSKIKLPVYKGICETTSEGRRYISPIGNKLPSVSTVMGYDPDKDKKLDEWRDRVGHDRAAAITKRSGDYGTIMHDCLDHYLGNNIDDLNTLYQSADFTPQIMFRKIKSFLDTHIQGIYHREQPVYSERLGIAGRFDCLCRMNDEVVLMDFKNSLKKKRREWIEAYFLQSTAYAEMVSEHTGIKINHFVIPIACFSGDFQVFTGKITDYREKMKNQIVRYYNEVIYK